MNKNLMRGILLRFRSNEAVCGRITGLMGLLSSKNRFRIVCALNEGDMSVSELISVLDGARQSNISIQLKLLTSSGVLVCRRKGKLRIYSITDDSVRALVGFLEKTFGAKR